MTRPTALHLLAGGLVVAALAGCAEPRPGHWALPVQARALPNLHRVDGGLYRSARLRAGAAEELKRLGVRTVLNLRGEESDLEALAGSGITRLRLPCNAGEMTVGHLAAFLRVVCDPERRPVLVHCWAGADRTGVMVAAYRVAAQGWSREEAVREMTGGGYSFHGLFYRNLEKLILELDVDELRRSAGIEAPPAPAGLAR